VGKTISVLITLLSILSLTSARINGGGGRFIDVGVELVPKTQHPHDNSTAGHHNKTKPNPNKP